MAKHPDKMTTLLTTTAAVTPVKLHNESWYDDIELEEANENCAALCNSATDAMEVRVSHYSHPILPISNRRCA